LACKLKALKVDLRKWNEEVFGHVRQQKKTMLEGIREIDVIGEGRALIEEEKMNKVDLSTELERLLLCEEVSWRQKSRALWLREGDKNTKFFHKVANSNRRNNSIEALLINGSLTSNVPTMKTHIVQFYSHLYSEQCRWRPKPDGLSFHSIDAEEGSWLERVFEEREVFEVVQAMNGDKALRPDGFSLAFMKACWVVLKEDTMALFQEFHSKGSFEKSLNTTFISLIPKKVGTVELKNFCPISLVGAVYKILSKVLANRLKHVLEKIISKSQNALFKGDRSWTRS
jgi:hypothetical protein